MNREGENTTSLAMAKLVNCVSQSVRRIIKASHWTVCPFVPDYRNDLGNCKTFKLFFNFQISHSNGSNSILKLENVKIKAKKKEDC